MAQVQFKGKIRTATFTDPSRNYDYIQIPELDRKHCDMAAFRSHPKFGSYANSDLFKALLQREKRRVFDAWLEQRRGQIQWEEIFVDNAYAIQYRKLMRVY